MATFDMTLASTAGVGADVLPVHTNVGNTVRTLEAILDIDAMITAGATLANGDIFQLLEVPAESFVIAAGAEIMKSFTAFVLVILTLVVVMTSLMVRHLMLLQVHTLQKVLMVKLTLLIQVRLLHMLQKL